MRSRRVLVAIVLLMVIVPGGVLVGVTGSFISPQTAAPSASPSTRGLEPSPAGLVFGAASNFSPGYSVGVSTSTVTTMSTTTAVATSTMAAGGVAGHGSTTVVQPDQQPRGAALAATANFTGGRDIEFFSNLTLLAVSTSSAFARASAIAYSDGGYVALSSETNSSALIELRVPATMYQDALTRVEALGTPTSLRSFSNDVTVAYSDLNATLKSLQAEETSLLAILTQSTNINTTLNVESRIQEVDQAINSVQGQILQTKTLISYATISVAIEQNAPTQPLTIKVTVTPRSGQSPLSTTFNALVKGGSQPYIVNYNFGDGSSFEGQALIHTFGRAGQYNVTVTATDSSANVAEAWTLVSVSSPPATSGFGGFPSFVGGLFLQVVEGIIEVGVVVIPLAAVLLVVLFPLRHRLGLSSRRQQPKDSGP